MPPGQRRLLRFVLVVLVTLGGLILSASATTISLINMDGPGEGFNDPTPVDPIGGNPGTTLGQQRLQAAQFAANIWADLLSSGVDIMVNVSFDSLGGDDRRAVLARARPLGAFRDFPGAPIADTWYPAALANALAGADLDPMRNDIRALVNSDVDGPVALGAVRFYYGFDLNAGNDELPCSVELVCGGACPQITGILPATGNYTLIALDAPFATEGESACTGGSYRATADGTGGMRLVERAANRTNTMGRNQAAVLSLTDFLAE